MENQTQPTVTRENVDAVISGAGQPGGLTLDDLLNLSPEEVDVMWEALMGEF